MRNYNFFVYITTNPKKTVYYTGVTNNLERRLTEHFENRGKPETFAGRYYCYKLLYFERYSHIDHAIEREKEIKNLTRVKKEELIRIQHPQYLFIKK